MIDPKYSDEAGYPGCYQYDGTWDGGDTAAIMGTIYALQLKRGLMLPFPFDRKVRAPLRHPDTTKWYGQPDRFSRDQLIPVLCTFVRWPDHYQLEIFQRSHRQKDYLTTWNTKGNGAWEMPSKMPDICGPEIWALWVRILKPKWAPLVLFALDIQTLVGSIQWRWFTPKTNRITRNHMLACLAARQMPSITSRLADKINNWQDLIDRWDAHCAAVGEYPTAQMFRDYMAATK